MTMTNKDKNRILSYLFREGKPLSNEKAVVDDIVMGEHCSFWISSSSLFV
jgi:hypothetical protein